MNLDNRIIAGQRNLSIPYLVPSRTLMRDSKVTTLTIAPVTRSDFVSQAAATNPGERETSSAQQRASVDSNTSPGTLHQQLLPQSWQPQQPGAIDEERPFKCKWPACEKDFARQHDYKRHEALHVNLRAYTCGGCKKTFARIGALNRHCKS